MWYYVLTVFYLMFALENTVQRVFFLYILLWYMVLCIEGCFVWCSSLRTLQRVLFLYFFLCYMVPCIDGILFDVRPWEHSSKSFIFILFTVIYGAVYWRVFYLMFVLENTAESFIFRLFLVLYGAMYWRVFYLMFILELNILVYFFLCYMVLCIDGVFFDVRPWVHSAKTFYFYFLLSYMMLYSDCFIWCAVLRTHYKDILFVCSSCWVCILYCALRCARTQLNTQ
jgi:hypothetical protein